MGYNITEKETAPTPYSHINGGTEEILARYCICELAQGWPVYRDASEWRNYRECFTDDAMVFTTWSGGLQIDDFIEVSKKGRSNGDFIMHRVNGVLADVNLSKNRGIAKLKATITQRFTFDGVEIDIDCDCRFIWFCTKIGNEWKGKWVKLFYEKDKLVPVNGKDIPNIFSKEELDKYPDGYKYLGVAQAKLGHQTLKNLPNLNNEAFYKMYTAMEEWLQGQHVDLRWND